MNKVELPSGWKSVKSREIFGSISDRSHNGQLQVLSATQDRGIVPRTEMDIDIKFGEKALPTYKKVVPGNFVIHLRSFQGGLAYSDVEGIISPAYTILKPKVEICDYYYKCLFQSVDYIKRLNSAVYGIRDGKQISYDTFGVIKIPLPPLSEQHAIAEILITADKLIATKEHFIATKQKQKQWLMQNLLTGKIRLPGFNREWKKVRLREIGYFSKGKGLSNDDKGSGNVPCLSYGEIYTTHNEYIKEFHSFISKEVAQYSYQLKKGDLLFTCSGETKEEIGKCVAFIDDFEAYASGDIIIISPTKEINSTFMGFLLNSYYVVKQKASYGQGDSIVHISKDSIERIIIYLPPLPEQHAIANVLSTADREIELLKKELEQQKQIKKHLMQKLLTGKIRVKGAEV